MAGVVGRAYGQRATDVLGVEGSPLERMLIDLFIIGENVEEAEQTAAAEPGKPPLKNEIHQKRSLWERQVKEKYVRG